jgi:hypothetical protein
VISLAVPAAGWVGSSHPEITPPTNFHQLRDTTDPALVRRLVFIDERWTRDQHDLHSRGDRGRLLLARVPHQHGKRLTFIAGLSHEGILAPCVTEGPINSDSFAPRSGSSSSPSSNPAASSSSTIPAATWRRIGSLPDCFSPDECSHHIRNTRHA